MSDTIVTKQDMINLMMDMVSKIDAISNQSGGNGGGGSRIRLTSSQSKLIGCVVLCTDGTEEKYSSFDDNLVAEFTGVSFTGTLTFSVTVGSDVVSNSFEVPYYGSYLFNFRSVTFKDWLLAGGLDPESYADFETVEKDEAAVRQLMTKHASVDILLDSTESFLSQVINSDVCAKWINLSDYAFDTYSGNENCQIKMNSSGKYKALYSPVPTKFPITSNSSSFGTVTTDLGYYDNWFGHKTSQGDLTYAYILFNSTEGLKNYGEYNDLAASKYIQIETVNSFTLHGINLIFWTNRSVEPITFYYKDVNTNEWVQYGSSIKFFALENVIQNYDTPYDSVGVECKGIKLVTGGSGSYKKICIHKFLPYTGEYGYPGLVSEMSSNVLPYGKLIVSTSYGSRTYNTFNQNLNETSDWCSDSTSNQWLDFLFPYPVKLDYFSVIPRCGVRKTSFPLTLRLQGTNKRDSWSMLLSDTNTKNPATEAPDNLESKCQTYFVNQNKDKWFRYIRVFVNGTYNTGDSRFALGQSQFYGKIYKPLIPAMTKDSESFCEVLASTVYSSCNPYKLFNRSVDIDSSTYNGYVTNYTTATITIDLKRSKCVKTIEIVNLMNASYQSQCVKDFQLSYSSDGINYTIVLTDTLKQPTQTVYPEYQLFDLNDSYEYRYWKIVFLTNYGADNGIGIDRLQFYGSDYNEKDWDANYPVKYLYDNGVKPNGNLSLSEYAFECGGYLRMSGTTDQISATMDLTNYDSICAEVDNKALGTAQLYASTSSQAFSVNNLQDGNTISISSLTGENSVGLKHTVNGEFRVKSLYVSKLN